MPHRLYVDEVGNGDLSGSATDDNVRYLSLTGILTKQDIHASRFQPEIDRLKGNLLGHTTATPVILHRSDIINRRGAFAKLRDPTIQAEFDAEILHLIESLPYRAITVTIDKRLHLQQYEAWHFDPYHYCMRCLIERYVLWLNRHNRRGDVVAEPRYKKVDKKLKASFRKTYTSGTEHVPARLMQARLLSHDLMFAPKAANVAGLQICDLVAHPSYRSMRIQRERAQEPADFGGRIAAILIKDKYSRNPKTEQIEGWGRKWLP